MNKLKQLWATRTQKQKDLITVIGTAAIFIPLILLAFKRPTLPTATALSPDSVLHAGPQGHQEWMVRPRQEPEQKEIPVITLAKRNTIVFRGVVTDESVAPLENKLMEMSLTLPKDEPIYLVMYTPGGSIDAGLGFIDFVKGLPRKVHTVSIFSASMGFHIVESLDDRLVLPSGTLMSHRAKASGMAGEVPGNLVTRMNHLLDLLADMDAKAAARAGMSLEAYREMIRDEYWVRGDRAVRDHMADKVVVARCESDLMGATTIDVQTLFGTAKVTFSECPIITGPLQIDVSAIKFKDDKQRQELIVFIKEMFEDPQTFVEEYIVTGKYSEFVPG